MSRLFSRWPHLVARGTFIERDGIRQAAPAPRFSRTPSALGEPPARPGQHTREALTDWGIADVDDLLRTGAAVPNTGAVQNTDAVQSTAAVQNTDAAVQSTDAAVQDADDAVEN